MTARKINLVKIFFWVLLSFLVVSGGISTYFILNKDQVIRAVVWQLNEKLIVPVEVNTIDVSLRHFPQLSIVFTDVRCKESANKGEDNLLQAKRVYFNFSLSDVLFSRYYISEIRLETGDINIKIFENGTNNYQIFKRDTTSIESTFKIDKLLLKNIRLTYSDFSEKIFLVQTIHNAIIQSTFIDSQIHSGYWSAKNIFIKTKDFSFEDKFEHSTNFDLEINQESIAINLKNCSLDGILLTISYNSNSNDKRFEISAKNQQLLTSDLIKKTAGSAIQHFQLKSDNTTAVISGRNNGKEWTFSGIFSTVIRNFNFRNGKFTAEQIKSVGSFDFQSKENYTVVLKTIDIQQKNSTFTGNIEISENSKQLTYEGSVRLEGTPSELFSLAGLTEIDGSGTVKANIEFKHKVKTSATGKIALVTPEKFKCTILSDNLALSIGDNRITLPSLHWHIDNDQLHIQQQADINGRKVFADLHITDISKWLLKEQEWLMAEGTISIDHYDEKFWNANHQNTSSTNPLSFLELLRLKLTFDIEKYNVDQLLCEQIHAILIKSAKDIIEIESLRLDLFGGSADFRGRLAFQKASKNLMLSGAAVLKKIDLSKLMQSFNDFNQQTLTHKNLFGRLSGNIQFSIPIDENFDPDFKKIQAVSDIKVVNGRLYNFTPIEALGRFVDIEELKDIRFEELSNNFVIENQLIRIPQFAIHSNALNLILEGTHTFENEIDYKVGLNLSEFLYQKRKRKKSVSDLIFEEDTDGAKLWIRISGTVDNPKITPVKAELIRNKAPLFSKTEPDPTDTVPSKKPVKSPYKFEWDEN